MPRIVLHGCPQCSREQMSKVSKLFETLPVCQEDVVSEVIFGNVLTNKKKDRPCVEILGSIEMSDEDMIVIANHFAETIDVELHFGWGAGMVFHEKGKRFTNDDVVDAVVALKKKLGLLTE